MLLPAVVFRLLVIHVNRQRTLRLLPPLRLPGILSGVIIGHCDVTSAANFGDTQ
jgi:hypothetical protein